MPTEQSFRFVGPSLSARKIGYGADPLHFEMWLRGDSLTASSS